MTQAYLEKRKSECSYQESNQRPWMLLSTELQETRGVKAIKLGSWDKHPALK